MITNGNCHHEYHDHRDCHYHDDRDDLGGKRGVVSSLRCLVHRDAQVQVRSRQHTQNCIVVDDDDDDDDLVDKKNT